MVRRVIAQLQIGHAVMGLAGLATFVAVSSVLADRRATVEVYVAAAPTTAGSLVAPSDLNVVAVAADSPLLEQLVRAGDGVDGRFRRDLAAGAVVLTADLLPAQSTIGHRTMTLPVDDVVLAGLGLVPGDQVDVIGHLPEGATGYVVAGVVVAQLSTSRDAFITLQVDQAQALRLADAMRNGDVAIVRSTGVPS